MTTTSPRMRIAIGNFPVASDERLKFAKQLGIDGVVLTRPAPVDEALGVHGYPARSSTLGVS